MTTYRQCSLTGYASSREKTPSRDKTLQAECDKSRCRIDRDINTFDCFGGNSTAFAFRLDRLYRLFLNSYSQMKSACGKNLSECLAGHSISGLFGLGTSHEEESSYVDSCQESAGIYPQRRFKNITFNLKLKGRLSKNIRSSIGIWGVRYWLMRLQQNCEISRALFRSVLAYYTSILCSVCGHTDRKNRLSQEMFQCSACGHAENADSNAAKNILNRFLTGKYGSCYKVAP